MKIFHVITRLILGGAQENTLLTCEGLHRRGHEVTLITGPSLGPEGQLLDRARGGGYRVVVLDSLRREIHPIHDFRALRKLRRLFDNGAESKPDLVHTHSSKAGILARKAAAQVGGLKVVHTIHGLAFGPFERAWRNRLYIALERRAARRTDAIISVADAMTAQALRAGVGRPEQYTTIYSGMDLAPFDAPETQVAAKNFRDSLGLSPERSRKKILVTQISRLAERKGHDDLLDAAERIDNPHVVFCFVGDGHLRSQLEQKIKDRNLETKIRLTGLVPPASIPGICRATDILVHCSRREGLARAIPQAMLSGRPVIAYDLDGTREVLDEQTGILLPDPDAISPKNRTQTLLDAIGKLAEEAPLRTRLGEAGKKRCRKMFDTNLMVQRIEDLYRNLLEK